MTVAHVLLATSRTEPERPVAQGSARSSDTGRDLGSAAGPRMFKRRVRPHAATAAKPRRSASCGIGAIGQIADTRVPHGRHVNSNLMGAARSPDESPAGLRSGSASVLRSE